MNQLDKQPCKKTLLTQTRDEKWMNQLKTISNSLKDLRTTQERKDYIKRVQRQREIDKINQEKQLIQQKSYLLNRSKKKFLSLIRCKDPETFFLKFKPIQKPLNMLRMISELNLGEKVQAIKEQTEETVTKVKRDSKPIKRKSTLDSLIKDPIIQHSTIKPHHEIPIYIKKSYSQYSSNHKSDTKTIESQLSQLLDQETNQVQHTMCRVPSQILARNGIFLNAKNNANPIRVNSQEHFCLEDDNSSLASHTELKLDNLYGHTQQLKQDAKNFEHKKREYEEESIKLGPTDFNLETVAVNDNGVWLKRVVFEQDRRPKLFYVKCCQQNTFMLDLKYQLWGFGESLFGQLGDRVETLKHPMNISQITKLQFDQISGGQDYVVAHSLTKQLYVWGNVPTHLPKAEQVTFSLDRDKKLYQIKSLNLTKYFNQIETSSNLTSLHSTKRSSKIIYFVETQSISAYNKHIYVLTKDGVLYPFGTQINLQQRFCGVSCGPNHVLAWEESGNVWSWGEFQDGKLGYMRFDEPEQKEPKLIIDFKAKAIQCVCGANYSIALDVKGDIYTWGKGPFKMDLSKAAMPSIIIRKKSPFIKIAAGTEHFGAINSSGQLYAWGSNKKGSIFNFPEEVLKPTQLPIEKRIIDFDMQSYNTVLIVQVDAKHHLPLINFEHFKSEQYKVISEEASLIQSYINKKTTIEFEKRKTEESKPKHVKSNSVPSSLPILFDKVQAQLMKLEQENQLYVPITHAKTARSTRVPSQENIELESVILSDNDQLKYEYIQLAREKDEEGLLLSILNDGAQKQDEIPMQTPQRVQINQFKHKFKIQKPVFHDKYDQFDKSIIQSTRNQIQEFNSKRAKKMLEQKRQRELEFERIAQQSIQSLQPIQSKAQLIQAIKEKAQQHLAKSRQVIQKKQEIVTQRINHFTEQLYEKSLDYRMKQRSMQREKLERQWALKFLLTFLNEQTLCQMFEETPEIIRSKAAIKIQRFFRKHQ